MSPARKNPEEDPLYSEDNVRFDISPKIREKLGDLVKFEGRYAAEILRSLIVERHLEHLKAQREKRL